jgi:alanine dehydrogenase
MLIGCVKEIKAEEYRVGVTPDNVGAYCRHGHRFLIECGAGLGSGYSDEAYRLCGATLVEHAADIWAEAEMIIKVKEPLEAEYPLLRRDQILFTFLHLASSQPLTRALLQAGTAGVAYETISEQGMLPCLKPMSEIAGRLSIQEGAKYLEKPFGGRGVLLGGVPGVRNARVVIIGAGTVGENALKVAVGFGADVTILDIDIRKLTALDDLFGNRIHTVFSSEAAISREIADADLVIGAVLIPGAHAPRLIRRADLAKMKPGAVLVDVAIDQGGCFETSRMTYHHDPIYIVDGIVHYCVGNMPGVVPSTATLALTNATLRYGLAIADFGLLQAFRKLPGLLPGLNTWQGDCTNQRVADGFSLTFKDPAYLHSDKTVV